LSREKKGGGLEERRQRKLLSVGSREAGALREGTGKGDREREKGEAAPILT